jgi:signal peptidase II
MGNAVTPDDLNHPVSVVKMEGMESQNEPAAVTQRGWTAALLLPGIIGLVLAADRLTKAAISRNLDRGEAWPSADWPVRIVHVTNSGAAFGLLQGTGPLLAAVSLLGVLVIAAYLVAPRLASPVFHELPVRIGLALMLGGAMGNLIDRWSKGEVVDFIRFPEFPAFNVADSAITIGVLFLAWGFLRQAGETPPQTASSEASSPTGADGSTR